MLPNADTLDLESEFDSDNAGEGSDNEEYNNHIHNILSYKQVHEQYSPTQNYLESDHKYQWVSGEKLYDEILTNEYLLKDSDIKKIRSSYLTNRVI